MATSENLNTSSLLRSTKIPQLDNIESDFHANLLENIVLTLFSSIIKNPVLSVWFYYLPFLSNIETQVRDTFPLNLQNTINFKPLEQGN